MGGGEGIAFIVDVLDGTIRLGAFFAGVARIHMAVLTVLSSGLLVSLSFFESEYKKAQMRAHGAPKGPAPTGAVEASGSNKVAKTD